MRDSSAVRARGSALLVVVVLLAILAAGIAAALIISSRERTAAALKGRGDVMQSCARAASRRLWAEVANSGGAMVGSVWAVSLPGGPQLQMGHYDQDKALAVTLTAGDLDKVKVPMSLAAASGGVKNLDTSNTFRLGLGDPSGALYIAHCRDTSSGNEYEVELFARFGL